MDDLLLRVAPQLRTLEVLVAHEGHMTRAADALGVPQSSMSRRLHQLAAELGVVLTVPEGRAIRLTPAAIALADHIRGPLAELRDALDVAATVGYPDAGTVRLGFPLTMGAGPVPAAIAELRRLYPRIALHLKQAHGAQLAEDLRSGQLDVALVIPPPEGIEYRLIGRQPIRAVVPPDHRLARRKRIRLAELAADEFIANPPTYHLRRTTETWCQSAGFDPSVVLEITEFSTIRELVSRGLGVALLPPADPGVDGSFAEVALESTYERQIALAWGPTARTAAARRVRDFLARQL